MLFDAVRAAEYLGYKSPAYVRRIARSGEIAYSKRGGDKGKMFFRKEDLDAFIDRNRHDETHLADKTI